MSKHEFRITVEHVADAAGNAPDAPPLTFNAFSHDNILAIVDRVEKRGDFSPESARAFGVGLKLFSEALLENKDNPLFESFRSHFGEFMKKLKQRPE